MVSKCSMLHVIYALTLKLPTSLSFGPGSSEAEQELCQAMPDRNPPRLAVAFSHQKTSESREVTKEIADSENRLVAKRTEHFKPCQRDDFLRR
jgi:hypothetical protein